MASPSGRIFYLECLRSIATIAVILLHVSAQNWGSVAIDSFSWSVFNAFDSSVRWCVPIFVMISGVLFLNPAKSISPSKLFKKSIFRLAIAFIIWSAIYAFDLYLQGWSLRSTALSFITGHYHMWFIFMMAGLYVITPILRKVTESLEASRYFLAVALVGSFIIPQALDALKLLNVAYSAELFSALNQVWNSTYFHITLGYSCYYVAGYYLNAIDISKKWRAGIYVAGIAGLAATILLTEAYSAHLSEPTTYFYGHMTLNVLATTIAVFVFAKYELTETKVPAIARSAVKKLSDVSFGVYLVHPLILEKLDLLGINTLMFDPIASVLLLTLLIAIISAIISAAIKRIPLLGKHIA